jgi:hypothetical protein
MLITTAKSANAAVTNAKLDRVYTIEWFCSSSKCRLLSFKLINVLDPTLAQDAATKTM